MELTPKAKKIFWDRIRKDEDDLWIWQGDVEKGTPYFIYDGYWWDAREFAFYYVGQTPPALTGPWTNKYNAKLDVNPAHNSIVTKNTDKYRGIENEGLGKTQPGGNSPELGNGTSQSAE